MTDFLEPKIKPLVEALNTWPGIRTFSSCEGHETSGGQSIPHVTFMCKDDGTLREICERLRGTAWKIALEDFSHGPELHFTLRYLPRSLGDQPTIDELQAGIASIADMLRRDTVLDPPRIENTFPVEVCPTCGETSFGVQAQIEFDLVYGDRLYPTLAIQEIQAARITCNHCSAEIKTGQRAVTRTWDMIHRANNEGALFTDPRKEVNGTDVFPGN